MKLNFLESQMYFLNTNGNSSVNVPMLQRKCSCGHHTGASGGCDTCKKKAMNGSESATLHETLFHSSKRNDSPFAYDFSLLRGRVPKLFEEDLRGQPEPGGDIGSMPDKPEVAGSDPSSPLDAAPSSAAVQTGETSCDTDTGKAAASTANSNECTKDCSMAHEKMHVADISECCAKAHEAKQKASTDGEKSKIDGQMKDWVDSNRPFLECRGYAESVKCADKKLKTLNCETVSPRPKCCTPLVWYLRSATQNRDANCNNAAKEKTSCPF